MRSEVSKRNPYWIGKERMLELKHFCMQYKEWKARYLDLTEPSGIFMELSNKNRASNTDVVSNAAINREYYKTLMSLVEDAALETDSFLCRYILTAVTEGRSYTYFRTVHNIPCCKDVYYDRYRRFFWILSNKLYLKGGETMGWLKYRTMSIAEKYGKDFAEYIKERILETAKKNGHVTNTELLIFAEEYLEEKHHNLR